MSAFPTGLLDKEFDANPRSKTELRQHNRATEFALCMILKIFLDARLRSLGGWRSWIGCGVADGDRAALELRISRQGYGRGWCGLGIDGHG